MRPRRKNPKKNEKFLIFLCSRSTFQTFPVVSTSESKTQLVQIYFQPFKNSIFWIKIDKIWNYSEQRLSYLKVPFFEENSRNSGCEPPPSTGRLNYQINKMDFLNLIKANTDKLIKVPFLKVSKVKMTFPLEKNTLTFFKTL